MKNVHIRTQLFLENPARDQPCHSERLGWAVTVNRRPYTVFTRTGHYFHYSACLAVLLNSSWNVRLSINYEPNFACN